MLMQIPIDYQRPPQHVATLATDLAPIYYIASDPRSGATPLFSVYELRSGRESCLSTGSYFQDAAKICLALRTLALQTASMPPNPSMHAQFDDVVPSTDTGYNAGHDPITGEAYKTLREAPESQRLPKPPLRANRLRLPDKPSSQS